MTPGQSIVVTGSAGLVGAEASRHFARQGYRVAGIDNDMRAAFFGEEASTRWSAARLKEECPLYAHHSLDIRDEDGIGRIFEERKGEIAAVIHAAAQPSHDWAARDPRTDFSVNAAGTLNLLECLRRHAPRARFVFVSTNKVYGDRPNRLDFREEETRWEACGRDGKPHPGIDESLSVDQSLHSLFGASKLSADLLVQEYGRYFGLDTVCFRGGCLTGGGHSGAELHGFLSYLMRCLALGREYRVHGYRGKQVRDNLHSEDLVRAFDHYLRDPGPARVYNIGGGRFANCSLREAVAAGEDRLGRKLRRVYLEQERRGDHRWYITDLGRFSRDYPRWRPTRSMDQIYDSVCEGVLQRLSRK